jgi:hypothetical protein
MILNFSKNKIIIIMRVKIMRIIIIIIMIVVIFIIIIIIIILTNIQDYFENMTYYVIGKLKKRKLIIK